MKRRSYFYLRVIFMLLPAMLLVGMFGPAITRAVGPPPVRVGISLSGNYVKLTLDQGGSLADREYGSTISLPPGTYRLDGSEGSIRVRDARGDNGGTFSSSLEIWPTGETFKLDNAYNGCEYRGSLEVAYRLSGGLAAINNIDLESYLQSVVSKESISSWGNYGGMEALKAQAITSRTTALRNLGGDAHQGDPYVLCDTQHCQVYGGKDAETNNTNIAVAETRGLVLTDQAVPIMAFYHSTNGGYTECPSNVWTQFLPYLRSQPDPFDDPDNPANIKHPSALWEKDIPLDVLGMLLTGSGPAAPVERVQVISTFPSGRVNEVCISGGGQTVSLFKERARTALDLRSQLYSVQENPQSRVWIASFNDGTFVQESCSELEGKWAVCTRGTTRMLIGEGFAALAADGRGKVPYLAYIFKGRGWGHGIGMSQYGAYNRARAGHTYREILSFYYPGTELLPAY